MLSALSTGTVYAFSVYSGALKHKFGISQGDIDSIGALYTLTGFISFIPGIILDRYGPAVTVLFGGLLATLCAVTQSLILLEAIHVSHSAIPATLTMLNVFSFFGTSCLTGAAFSTIVRNFPNNYSTWVSFSKGFVGIAGGLLTQMFCVYHVPDNDPKTLRFVIFVAFVLFINTLICYPFLKNYSGGDPEIVAKRVRYMAMVIFVGVTCIIAGAFLQHKFTQTERIILFIILTSLYFGPFGLCLSCLDEKQPSNTAEIRSKFPSPDLTVSEILHDTKAYLIMFVGIYLVGGGILVTTNLSQQLESIHQKHYLQTCISLFSVVQCLARICSGFICDYFPSVPRPYFLTLACSSMTVGYALFYSFTAPIAIFLAIICVAFAFGFIWPMLVMITKELYGTKNHGRNYLFYDGICNAIGAVCIAKFLPQHFYRAHKEHDSNTCIGHDCFQATYLIVGCYGIFATCAAFMLGRLSSTLYFEARSMKLIQDDPEKRRLFCE